MTTQLPEQQNHLEVLKDIVKNCDMDTQTAVEKLFRQYHVYLKSHWIAEVRTEVEGRLRRDLIPELEGDDNDDCRTYNEALDDVLQLPSLQQDENAND